MENFITWFLDNKVWEWLFSGAGVAVFLAIVGYIYKQRQTASSQVIKSGNNSTNIQAGQNINIGTNINKSHVE